MQLQSGQNYIMLISNNIILFFIAICISTTIIVIYDRLRSKPFITREDHLEHEVKRLTRQVEALQATIDVLSNRTKYLQDENERLRNELRRVIPQGNWRTMETGLMRNALDKLSAEELHRIAFEQFRPVFDGFTSDQSLHSQRLALMEYAENRAQLDKLHAAIIAINQAAFG